MSFEEEWNQLKADALRRRNAGMELDSAGGGVPSTPLSGLSGNADLGLTDAPIRAKATDLRTAHAEAKDKSKLHDAAAVGKAHPGWDAGAASNDCVAAWQAHLHELSDLVETAADALTKAMDEQISQDGSVAAQLRKSAGWLEDA
ncbi:hypothetical protein ABB07_20220 [Streptomyces incarnatus]|uniref:DUF4226 domain-containing protein n=1 Tax=Streptomyces incarnatus TaxID=665007 RepID=A0ABN4GEM6_9ACTN|nr:hypothetical protein [Streptomyces incarnatus]AKJ12268.1 hypothetical protein ABB07_20220 [Streptomyces incarnatus]